VSNIPFTLGDIEIHWLGGGDFRLDGGAMFGAVPKVLWQKVYPADSENTIPLCNDPLLLKTKEDLIVIDTGLGNKLSKKLQNIYKVGRQWNLPARLESLGYGREDVTQVILTHCDFDHAGGIEMVEENGTIGLTFPAATHFIQEKEWQDVEKPHRRAESTYFPENFALLCKKGKLELINGNKEVSSGVMLFYTGGHTRGHQIVEIRSNGSVGVHLGDLLPTHVHNHPLWTMSYDNFPLEVIDRKSELLEKYTDMKSWFFLYHDPFVRACRLDGDFKVKEKWQAGKQESLI